MKKMFVLILSLFFGHVQAQEWQIAVINDPDGFSFIRSGAGKTFPVLDTVQRNSFFYCTGDTGKQWIAVQKPYGKPGFMHRSRILFFYELDSVTQHILIINAFCKTVDNYNSYWEKAKKCPKDKIVFLNMERDRIYEENYIPAYTAFEKLFSIKPDSALLVTFFKTLPSMTGSADEGKDWTSAKCWITHPQFVNNIVCHWKIENERKIIISSIETGMAMADLGKNYSPAQLKKMYAELERKCN